MSRNKILVFIATLVLVSGVGWYFASPTLAMSSLKDAAIEGDKDELAERIDFPALRENLKSQFSARMAVELAANEEESGLQALGAAMAMGLMGSMIDGLITPESMAAMIQEGTLKREQTGEPEPEGEPVEWEIERDGLDKFRAVPVSADDQTPPALVFERDGLGWLLTGIEIPDDAFSDSDV